MSDLVVIVSFLRAYWPHVLVGSLAVGFAGPVWTATGWALRRRGGAR